MSGKLLTIGMSVYDDYDGAYFTIQSIRAAYPHLREQLEFLVIDNNPGSVNSDALRSLMEYWIKGTYVPFNKYSSTSVRNLVFEYATADAVLCMDCHVILWEQSLPRLLDYYAANPQTRDLLQGPLVYDDCGPTISTHFKPEWRAEMFGTWDTDERGRHVDAPPFEIPMSGLGLFSCRRDAWLGFHPAFRQFGGEEGYIHEKFRLVGQRTLCLPFLRWVHRFHRASTPYPITNEQKLRNYLIGALDLGMSPQPALEHFERVSPVAKTKLMAEAEQLIKNHGRFVDRIVPSRPVLELPATV